MDDLIAERGARPNGAGAQDGGGGGASDGLAAVVALMVVVVALLVAVAVTTTQSVLDAVHGGGVETPYTQYLASGWPVAIGLLVGGFVVNRFARIIVGR